ncbi:Short-chain dehydrogenase/reductase SDR [Kalmanozyma brasiliensis GHG001]|uniref:Short-chain dehydrogenase/reductase SDR n=1 Tax=Kalmanozyma brasiliensis (strain GHG001) TaxID=1365824 RepID=UPI002867FED1|nr:Short-chain dehydrogenase/reductase SDR [Kalmanozyma brasiliensis GHG001]KAF6766777.1 Short-chain dehydrogenase/reductase SDR [Kalmanozyma brasiliensis GHG001]
MVGTILDFECAVITGGAGGLGYAMAEYFLSLNKKVILVGRTESKLAEASKKLSNAPYYVLDTGSVKDIPAFTKKVLSEHPEVDCLINNAGVQRPLEVQNLALDKVDNEIDINIRGPVHLATAFLDHLKTKKLGVIVNVSSVLGFVPYSIINPVYNSTKAFCHFWSEAQRVQLKNTNVRVVEIVPPSVGTDLHRERENPDDNKKEKGATSSLTIAEFMEDLVKGLKADQDVISAGSGIALVKKWDDAFREQFNGAADKYQPK